MLSLAMLSVSLGNVGCAQSQKDARPDEARSAWMPLSQEPKITISLDTTRITRVDGAYRLWVGFDLAEPWPPMEDVKAPYRHFEAEHEVDCERRRTRSRSMRILDVNGAVYDTPSPDSTWKGFADHPLTEDAFTPVCAALVTLRK